MPCSRKVLQLADLHSFNMQSCKTMLLSSYALSLLSMMGEVANTHRGMQRLQCEQGSPSCGAGYLAQVWESLGSGSWGAQLQNAALWWIPGALTGSALALLQVWLWCLAVVFCPHCDSATWASARSSCSFAALCLWLECNCLCVVLETVYINHTNKAFTRNGPLNRIT